MVRLCVALLAMTAASLVTVEAAAQTGKTHPSRLGDGPRITLGLDATLRTNLLESITTPVRFTGEYGVLAPRAQTSGVTLGLYAGLGFTKSVYVDGGARLGYRWVWDGLGLGVGYDLGVSYDREVKFGEILQDEPTPMNNVLVNNHRLFLDFGGERGFSARLGLGFMVKLKVDDDRYTGSNEEKLNFLLGTIGVMYRL